MPSSKYPLLQPLHLALLSRKNSSISIMAQKNSCSIETLLRISDIIIDYSQRGCPINPLQAVIMAGNYRICKQLLQEDADLSSPSSVPPPLHLALEMDKFQIARLLIDSGADVFLSHLGLYPMFYALKANTPEFIIETIIKAGFHPDSMIEEKCCNAALHKAVAYKNIEAVKTLIKLNADCNVKETHLGYTPLHIAVNSKVPLLAKILVDNGADLEAEDNNGWTPLFHAIRENDVCFVIAFLEMGANKHHLSSRMLVYPLNFAASLGYKSIVEALLKEGADHSKVAPGKAGLPIHSASLSTNGKTSASAEQLKGIVELLIEKGSEVDVPNMCGSTPIQLALRERNFSVVEVLIKEGAGINGVFDGGTIFHYIAKVANKELVDLCLKYGADYSKPDSDGNTPYHLALYNHDSTVLNTFWKFGCPFDIPTNGSTGSPSYPSKVNSKLDNQKKYMLGIKENNVNMMESALANGAEVRSCSMDIPYPLHYAVSNGFSSVVLLLLEKGVPSNIIDDKGESPLHIAACKGYFQICRYLLRFGACYDLLSKQTQRTPLDLALENNRFDVVYILREIDLMFKSSVNETFESLQGTFKKSNNVQSLQAYINSVNRSGETLMAVAIRKRNFDLAENLMKLRQQIIKA